MSSSRVIVYQYEYGTGGVADIIKYLFHTVDIAMKAHASLRIWINHPIATYMNINPEYRITERDTMVSYRLSQQDSGLQFTDILHEHPHLMVRPTDYYMLNIAFDLSDEIDFKSHDDSKSHDAYNLADYITFTPEIHQSLAHLQPNPTPNPQSYIAIHYRLGDHYLETVPKIWYVQSDNRRQPDFQILRNITTILDKNKTSGHVPVYFLSDNNQYKQIIRQYFPSLLVFDNQILNPSYVYNETNETYMKGLKSAIVEFLFLSQSKEIHALSYSGFTIMSSYIGHVPLTKWYNEK